MKFVSHLSIARSTLAILMGCLLGACATTRSSASPSRGWLEPSPILREEIENKAQRIPWTNTFEERIELIQWFAGVGEPAYPYLLAMVTDPRPRVAGSALAALGSTGDPRLIEPLRALPWPTEDNIDLALERARTLMQLGDWSLVPLIIEGLRDERFYTRAVCAKALSEATHEPIEFDPEGEADVREQQVLQWEAWWHARADDQLLQEVPHGAFPGGPANAQPQN
jgi:hypothetical protein